jgi:DNA-binding MarR family transcriptional regulator
MAGLVTEATAMHPEQAGSAASAHRDEYSCARAWAALTSAHARITEQLSTALGEACGLSINDFEILLRLDQVPPPGLRLGGLSPAVRLTQPSLSRAVARLERRGWLRRTGTTEDRRGVVVTTTPAGRDVLRRAAPVHARIIREFLLEPLTEAEQGLLTRVLARITES